MRNGKTRKRWLRNTATTNSSSSNEIRLLLSNGIRQPTINTEMKMEYHSTTIYCKHTTHQTEYILFNRFFQCLIDPTKCGGWQKLVFLWWILSKIFFLSKSTRLRSTKLKCARYEKCAHCIHISSFRRKQKTGTSTHTHTHTRTSKANANANEKLKLRMVKRMLSYRTS